jgi:hypothetical protein
MLVLFPAFLEQTQRVLESIDITTFAGRIGEQFRLLAGAAPIETTLVAVTPAAGAPSAAQAGRRIPFSLLFRAPLGTSLPQRIYEIEHEDLGTLSIFLVPVGPDGGGMGYEAVFT